MTEMNCSLELDAVVPFFLLDWKLHDIEFNGICNVESVEGAKLGREMKNLLKIRLAARSLVSL